MIGTKKPDTCQIKNLSVTENPVLEINISRGKLFGCLLILYQDDLFLLYVL